MKSNACRSVIFAFCLLPGFAASQTPDAEALKVVADFADRLCQTVPLDTSSSRVELSGSAKAELDGIVKKLASLGIQGAGKYESTDSKNVLQKDLASVLQKSRDCRLQVWNDLKSRFDIGAKPKQSEVCRFRSIRSLGWKEGHKTDFCVANGYPHGNFNQGKYKNGGICIAGPEPEVCKAFVTNRLPSAVKCSQSGEIVSCVR